MSGLASIETLPWATRIAFEDQDVQSQAFLGKQHLADGSHGDMTATAIETADLSHGGPFGIENSTLYVLAVTLTASQDNWTSDMWPTAAIVRWTCSGGARTLTGLKREATGGIYRRVLFMNVGANNLTLSHADAASLSGNRFRCPGAVSFVLNASDAVWICYDQASLCWQVEAY